MRGLRPLQGPAHPVEDPTPVGSDGRDPLPPLQAPQPLLTWCLRSCSSRLLSASALRARVMAALLSSSCCLSSSSSTRCLQEPGNRRSSRERVGRPGVTARRTGLSGTWLPAGPVAPSPQPPRCRAAAAAAPRPAVPAPGAAQTCRTVMALTPRWVTRCSMPVTLLARAVTSAHRDLLSVGCRPSQGCEMA